MNLFVHSYELSTPWHGSKHSGALLKIEFDDGSVGYADIHPWPELGDPSLEQCLRSLVEGQPLIPIVMQATRLGQEDARARSEGRSLAQGYTVPLSHCLIPSLSDVTLTELNELSAEGFTHLKVKMGRNLPEETKLLKKWVTLTSFKWRLDFNARVSSRDFDSWFTEARTWLEPYLDGIEDPAIDLENLSSEAPFFADRSARQRSWGLIWKPEIAPQPEKDTLGRVWITNNLGHPYGHSVAATCAARFGRTEVAGLQGLKAYPSSAWTEAIRYFGPVTLPLPGLGFGGDDLLEKIAWRKLK